MRLAFHCNYCPTELPHFKALVEHYKTFHEDHLKRYQVRSKKGHGQGIISATSEEEACRFFGWHIDECKIKELDNIPMEVS